MDGRFCYMLTGWEGAASDARVLESAYTTGFVVPEGKFCLADTGMSSDSFI
jgi:hypothetical protein